jgi:hypothetical protein
MKTCKKCNCLKAVSEFYKDKSYPDGIGNRCANCMKQKTKSYYSKNIEIVKEKRRAKYAENPDAERKDAKLRSRKWRKENPAHRNALKAKYKADKIQATPKWLTKDHHAEIKEFYEMAKELEKVFPWKQHVDHIVPLNHDKVCGLHTPWNLQILSAKANMDKSNKFEVA